MRHLVTIATLTAACWACNPSRTLGVVEQDVELANDVPDVEVVHDARDVTLVEVDTTADSDVVGPQPSWPQPIDCGLTTAAPEYRTAPRIAGPQAAIVPVRVGDDRIIVTYGEEGWGAVRSGDAGPWFAHLEAPVANPVALMFGRDAGVADGSFMFSDGAGNLFEVTVEPAGEDFALTATQIWTTDDAIEGLARTESGRLFVSAGGVVELTESGDGVLSAVLVSGTTAGALVAFGDDTFWAFEPDGTGQVFPLLLDASNPQIVVRPGVEPAAEGTRWVVATGSDRSRSLFGIPPAGPFTRCDTFRCTALDADDVVVERYTGPRADVIAFRLEGEQSDRLMVDGALLIDPFGDAPSVWFTEFGSSAVVGPTQSLVVAADRGLLFRHWPHAGAGQPIVLPIEPSSRFWTRAEPTSQLLGVEVSGFSSEFLTFEVGLQDSERLQTTTTVTELTWLLVSPKIAWAEFASRVFAVSWSMRVAEALPGSGLVEVAVADLGSGWSTLGPTAITAEGPTANVNLLSFDSPVPVEADVEADLPAGLIERRSLDGAVREVVGSDQRRVSSGTLLADGGAGGRLVSVAAIEGRVEANVNELGMWRSLTIDGISDEARVTTVVAFGAPADGAFLAGGDTRWQACRIAGLRLVCSRLVELERALNARFSGALGVLLSDETGDLWFWYSDSVTPEPLGFRIDAAGQPSAGDLDRDGVLDLLVEDVESESYPVFYYGDCWSDA